MTRPSVVELLEKAKDLVDAAEDAVEADPTGVGDPAESLRRLEDLAEKIRQAREDPEALDPERMADLFKEIADAITGIPLPPGAELVLDGFVEMIALFIEGADGLALALLKRRFDQLVEGGMTPQEAANVSGATEQVRAWLLLQHARDGCVYPERPPETEEAPPGPAGDEGPQREPESADPPSPPEPNWIDRINRWLRDRIFGSTQSTVVAALAVGALVTVVLVAPSFLAKGGGAEETSVPADAVKVWALVIDGEHYSYDQFEVARAGDGCDASHYRAAGVVRSLEGSVMFGAETPPCGFGLVSEVRCIEVAWDRAAFAEYEEWRANPA